MVSTKAHFKEMSNVAHALKCSELFSVEMILAESLREEEVVVRFFQLSHIPIRYFSDEFFAKKTSRSKKNNVIKKILNRFFLHSSPLSAPFILLHLIRRKFLAKRLINTLKPDLVILPNLGIGGVEDYVNYWSKKNNFSKIPVVIIPYAWNPSSELYTARKNYKIYQTGFLYSLVKKILKRNWALSNIQFYPFYKIAMIELVGSSVQNPWNGDDSADAIFLESPKMASAFLMDKGSLDKVRITGSLSQDKLYQYSQDPVKSFNVPYIIFAVPPDQTGNMIPGFEFSNYTNLITCWVKFITDQKVFKVLLSIHPREESIKEILLKMDGVEIYEGDILKIIPDCKLFICSISGLVRSTALMGIKSIYYDCFHYNLMEYRDVKTVEYAFSFEHFKDLFTIFTNNYLNDNTLALNIDIDNEWGFYDGKSVDRTIEELKLLLN